MPTVTLPSETSRVQLHIHLDGSIPPTTLLRVARRRNLSLPVVGVPSTVADVLKALHSMTPAWHEFDLVNDVLGGDAATLREVAAEFVAGQAAQGVDYVEVRYDPVRAAVSHYANVSISEREAVEAIADGLRAGAEAHGIEAHQLLCAMRGSPAAACFELVELAAATRSGSLGGVVGIDLAGDEYHYNNSYGDVEACFHHAKASLGLNITVHAGEMSGPQDVASAIFDMGADRIGHGYSAMHDAQVTALLARTRTHLEACPANHPQDLPEIDKYRRLGLNFGLSTDDPASYFGNTSMPGVEHVVTKWLRWQPADLATAYANARAGAFAPHARAVVAAERRAAGGDVSTARWWPGAADAAVGAALCWLLLLCCVLRRRWWAGKVV